MSNRPFYNKLYADLIRDKYPEKQQDCNYYLQKENWTALDVIQVNELLFGSKQKKSDNMINQKHRAYDQQSIKQILKHQLTNQLTNKEVSKIYGLSRNTIAKWRKVFPELCSQDESDHLLNR